MTKNEKKLIEAVKSVPFIANKEGWVFTFDKEEGTLFYSPKIIPNGAELHQVTDEYALYLDKQFNPKAVMVEYFNHNFVKHHKIFEALSKRVFSGKDKIKIVNPKLSKDNSDARTLKALFNDVLLEEAGSKLIPA